MCGDDGEKVTPVPIPNTEVKLLSADCSEGFPFVRVGRLPAIRILYILDSFIGRFSSAGEHLPYKQRVGGSIRQPPLSDFQIELDKEF